MNNAQLVSMWLGIVAIVAFAVSYFQMDIMLKNSFINRFAIHFHLSILIKFIRCAAITIKPDISGLNSLCIYKLAMIIINILPVLTYS